MEQRVRTPWFRNDRHERGPRDAAHAVGAAGQPPMGGLLAARDSPAQVRWSEEHAPRRGHLRLVTEAPDPTSPGELMPGRGEEPHPPRSESPSAPIRVLIADAHGLMRAGYRALLENAGIEVVAEAATAEQAVVLAGETSPDVALLDPQLAVVDDLQEIATLVAHPALVGVAVMLTASAEDGEVVLRAVRAGAVGVLRKDDKPETLIESVRLLAEGQAVLPADAVRRLFGELRPRLSRQTCLTGYMDELTEREREVVALAAEGLANAEIAARLVISPATAKTHISRAMIKLHARHRAELVAYAYEHRLVVPRLATTSPRIADADSTRH